MTNLNIPLEDPILEWSAPSHLHHNRTRAWYIVAVAFIALCLGYSIWSGGWTFTVLIVVLTGLYWNMHRNEPENKRMRIWKHGFAINETFIEWSNCIGYWILRGGHHYELHIERRAGANIKILLGEINPYLLHDLLPHLLPHLPDKREGVLDTIIRICKL